MHAAYQDLFSVNLACLQLYSLHACNTELKGVAQNGIGG